MLKSKQTAPAGYILFFLHKENTKYDLASPSGATLHHITPPYPQFILVCHRLLQEAVSIVFFHLFF